MNESPPPGFEKLVWINVAVLAAVAGLLAWGLLPGKNKPCSAARMERLKFVGTINGVVCGMYMAFHLIKAFLMLTEVSKWPAWKFVLPAIWEARMILFAVALLVWGLRLRRNTAQAVLVFLVMGLGLAIFNLYLVGSAVFRGFVTTRLMFLMQGVEAIFALTFAAICVQVMMAWKMRDDARGFELDEK